MKKLLGLALLVLVVFLSGCTYIPQIGQQIDSTKGISSGVIIKSFKPDISEIFSGDSIVFSVVVENIGEEDADSVKATIFGLSTDWSGDDWTNKEKEIGFLQKSQADYDIPGGQGDAQWDLTSPSGLKVDNTYTAGVRVTYSYGTTALGNIKIVSDSYIKSHPEDAEEILRGPGLTSFSVTKAPVAISFAGVARPLIYRKEDQKAIVTVELSNIGQGKPYQTNRDDMKITITKLQVNNQDCESTIDSNPKLPRTGKKSVACKFTLPSVEDYTTIPIDVELSYNYFVEAETSIKVLKEIV